LAQERVSVTRTLEKKLTRHTFLIVLAILSLGVTVVGTTMALKTRRDVRRLGQQLHDEDLAIALEAVEELRERGWLYDGRLVGGYMPWWNFRATNLQSADLSGAYLKGAAFGARYDPQGQLVMPAANLRAVDLSGANLQEVDLREVDLRGANFADADLRGAVLLDANLLDARGLTDLQYVHIYRMRGARMPDGTRYDGRYRNRGDHAWAREHDIDTKDPVQMAAYYGVPLEVFLDGREWAEQNLKALRKQSNAEAVEQSAGVEPGGVAVLTAVVFSVSAAILLGRALPGPRHEKENP
jgi:uncharacterized protein YjbI with pentapeptide repeats